MQTPTLADYQRAGVGGAGWQRGTRWSGGLSDDEIATIEKRHGIRFPPDHRLFLEHLHATTPRRVGAASWGARPAGESERRDRVAALVEAAPALLPIFGHRFVLADGPTAVLSIHQSDIIVYGSDLRAYLLAELGDQLGLPREGHGQAVDLAGVPFWGELVG